MAFQVELSRRAANDIEEIFHDIEVESDAPMNAARWRPRLSSPPCSGRMPLRHFFSDSEKCL